MKNAFVLPSRCVPLQRFFPALLALVALGTGLVGARAQSSSATVPATSQSISNMQHFVIIFRQGSHPLTEADKARRQQEVSAWARVQNAAGHKLEPRILAPDVLRPGASTPGGSGVSADAWSITALLFLEARDLFEAAKVAEAHPANHFGASLEVRPWAPPVVPAAPPPR